jgi:hypothetical protein
MSDHAERLGERPTQRRRVNLGDPAVRAELARTADGRRRSRCWPASRTPGPRASAGT